jgi:hypothetical protein
MLSGSGSLLAQLSALTRPRDFGRADKRLRHSLGLFDRFLDLTPYHHDLPSYAGDRLGQHARFKVALRGLVLTCAGLIIHKGQGDSRG